MKRFTQSCILTLALLSLAFLMAGCDAGKPAATAPEAKIGVVNLEKVFAEAKAAKEGVKLLQSIQAQYEPRLRELQAKNKDDDTANKEFGELIGKYQGQMTSEQTRISTLINEGMSKVLNSYVKSKGYKLIVGNDKALAYDDSLDITPSIVQDLDALNLDVGAAPKAPEAVPAPAPAPEAAPVPAPTPAPAEKPAQ